MIGIQSYGVYIPRLRLERAAIFQALGWFAPALVMVGEQDVLKTPGYARAIAGGIPKAEFAIIPSAGHAVSWEQPGVFNSLLLGFVLKHAVNL